jgi:hypothetical protein
VNHQGQPTLPPGEWMRFGFSLIHGILIAGIALLAMPHHLVSQESGLAKSVAAVSQDPANTVSKELPDAPEPQVALAVEDPASQQIEAGQSQNAQQPASAAPQTQSPSAPTSSSSQTQSDQPSGGQDIHEKSEEQLKAEEHQRVMGVMATFNTTSNRDALPLTPRQKFQLFFKSETDPWPFGLAAVVSGIGMAEDSYHEWGQGVQGYAKRFGAAYSDAFIGNFFGNAVLPTLLHEDPRFYQKGSGKFINRALWAAASTVWCRRDNRTWGPNYSNIIGNFIGAAISDTYYPPSQRTVPNTLENGLTVSAEGIVGAEVIEFWPDIVRHHQRKKAEKAARLAAQDGAAQTGSQAAPAATPKSPQN